MSRFALAAVLVLAPVASLGAQTATPVVAPNAAIPAATADSMRPLAWLVGEWEGTGWMARGAERFTFAQRETVRMSAGGGVLVIDGNGTSTDKGHEGAIIHQAFATIVWVPDSSSYRMRSYRAGGGEGADRPTVADGRIVWGLAAPGGRVRFTIERTSAGEWHEVGDFVRAGEPADAKGARFFEMTLRKK